MSMPPTGFFFRVNLIMAITPSLMVLVLSGLNTPILTTPGESRLYSTVLPAADPAGPMVAPTNSKYVVSKLISALTPAIAAPPVVSVSGRSAGAPKSLHGNATSLNVRAEVPPGIIVVVVGAVVVVVESTVVVTGGTVVVTGGTVVVAGGTVVVVVGATVVVVGA